eukprot:scaffold1515_cov162-Amphora_coffeaeformis.AAC.8
MTLRRTSPPLPFPHNNNNGKEFHVAPMMGVTFREFRYFVRLLSKHAILWTEMVVDDTILHTDSLDYHLGFDKAVEPPIVCQIGGNQDEYAAAVTRTVIRDYGYHEINLNAGCPSHRVASKRAFGAALLTDVDKAVAMLQAMQEGVSEESTANVSIKLRIGVDDCDDLEWTTQLIARLSTVCKRFYVHARKVHTAGLDPAQNRRIPPLHYPRVYELCRRFPDCDFWINGGILTVEQAIDVCFGVSSPCEESSSSTTTTTTTTGESPNEPYQSLVPPGHGPIPCATCQQPNGSCVTPPLGPAPTNLRGCLVGRAMMDDPIRFAVLDTEFYGATTNPSQNRRQVLGAYADYLQELYPRRCGDCFETNSARVTTRHPGIEPVKDYYCGCCQEGKEERPLSDKPPPQLMHRHIIGRALKPVQGVFCGVAGVSRPWRRLLQQAMNDDIVLMNCGPAFLLRRAVKQLEEGHVERIAAILDEPFKRRGDDD